MTIYSYGASKKNRFVESPEQVRRILLELKTLELTILTCLNYILVLFMS